MEVVNDKRGKTSRLSAQELLMPSTRVEAETLLKKKHAGALSEAELLRYKELAAGYLALRDRTQAASDEGSFLDNFGDSLVRELWHGPLADLTDAASGGLGAVGFDKASRKLEERASARRARTQLPDIAREPEGGAGEFLGTAIGSVAPSAIALAIPGAQPLVLGYYGTRALGAGRRHYREAVREHDLAYNPGTEAMVALGYATVEFAFERLGLERIGKVTMDAAAKIGQKMFSKAPTGAVAMLAKAMGQSSLAEGGEEAGTEVAQNFIDTFYDPDVERTVSDLFEGSGEAFALGAAGGAFLAPVGMATAGRRERHALSKADKKGKLANVPVGESGRTVGQFLEQLPEARASVAAGEVPLPEHAPLVRQLEEALGGKDVGKERLQRLALSIDADALARSEKVAQEDESAQPLVRGEVEPDQSTTELPEGITPQERDALEAVAPATPTTKERETEADDPVLTALPAQVDDAMEEARRVGYFEAEGTRIERQPELSDEEAVFGPETDVLFTNDRQVPARFAIVDIGRLEPSHRDGTQNRRHFIPEAQPRNRSALFTKSGRLKPVDDASRLNIDEIIGGGSAHSNAPATNLRGESVQGSGRLETIRHAYESFPEKGQAYKDRLLREVQSWAAKPEEEGPLVERVQGMERPALVRVMDVGDQDAIALGQISGKRREAVATETTEGKALARVLDEQALQKIDAALVEVGEDVPDLPSLVKKVRPQLVDALVGTGAIEATAQEGVTDAELQNMMTSLLFTEADINTADIFDQEVSDNSAKKGFVRGVGSMLRVRGEADLRPHLADAVRLVHDFKASPIRTFNDFLFQGEIGRERPLERSTPQAITFARLLLEEVKMTQKDLGEKLRSYERLTKGASFGEDNLFQEERRGMPPLEAFKEAFAEAYPDDVVARAKLTELEQRAREAKPVQANTIPEAATEPEPTSDEVILPQTPVVDEAVASDGAPAMVEEVSAPSEAATEQAQPVQADIAPETEVETDVATSEVVPEVAVVDAASTEEAAPPAQLEGEVSPSEERTTEQNEPAEEGQQVEPTQPLVSDEVEAVEANQNASTPVEEAVSSAVDEESSIESQALSEVEPTTVEVSSNRFVKEDEIDAIKARLRQKLNSLNAGLDPETAMLGFKVAAYYIERGARTFAAYAEKMIADFGNTIRPYLLQFYVTAKYNPDFNVEGMDDMATAEAAFAALSDEVSASQTEATEEAEPEVEEAPQLEETASLEEATETQPREGGTAIPSSVPRAGGDVVQRSLFDTLTPRPDDGSATPSRPLDGRRAPVEQALPAGTAAQVQGDTREASPTRERNDNDDVSQGVDADESGATGARSGLTSAPGDAAEQRSDSRRGRSSVDGRGGIRSDQVRDGRLDLRQRGGIEPQTRNLRLTEESLVPSGQIGKIRANLEALRLLKTLEGEGREATPDERRILASYSGWGHSPQLFDKEMTGNLQREGASGYWKTYLASNQSYQNWKKKYGHHVQALSEVLTPEELEAAADSTINAHFTSPTIIKAMWQMVERLGFKGGTILEPAAGVGHFLGYMPQRYYDAGSHLLGIELDPISGKILQHLYPDASIQVTGYEDAKGIGPGMIDLAISNVPFGQYTVADTERPSLSKWSIHDYFFGRTLEALRPGGLLAFVTSRYTMDRLDDKVRKELAEYADLVSAVRLPSSAFKSNAGTEVVTDIVILRKKTDKPFSEAQPFIDVVPIEVEGETVYVNSYYSLHPEMVVGTPSLTTSMYREKEYTVTLDASGIEGKLGNVTASLPENVVEEVTSRTVNDEPLFSEKPEGSLAFQKGQLMVVGPNGTLQPHPKKSYRTNKKRISRFRHMEKLAETYERLVLLQQSRPAGDEEVEKLRWTLNRQYDAFRRAFSNTKDSSLHSGGNSFLKSDPRYSFVLSLEKKKTDDEGNETYEKGPIFSQRTSFPYEEPTHAESVPDAFYISLNARGTIDLAYISELTGQSEEEIVAAFVVEDLAYLDPTTGMWVDKETYLSGNVKIKLAEAERHANNGYDRFRRNVEALQEVQPPQIPIERIAVRLGASWVPPSVVEAFLNDVLDTYGISVEKSITQEDVAWTVTGGGHSIEASTTFGVAQAGWNGQKIAESLLNLRTPVVRVPDGNGRPVVDQKLTLQVENKARALQQRFREWVNTTKHGETLAQIYNQKSNNLVVRKSSVPRIDHYPGANPNIMLRDHQKQAVSRALRESVLLAHVVGSGKTFTLITTAMEMRRLGLAKKPMIVVFNATLEQFEADFRLLYPSARLMVASSEGRARRRSQLAQMAAGDYDAIVIPQSYFDRIDNDPLREKMAIQSAKAQLPQGRGKGTKAQRTARKRLEAKLKRVAARIKSGNVGGLLTFEQLGVDALLVDEAHAYKRYNLQTKMNRVKGIDTSSSNRSMSFDLKVSYIRSKNSGRNVVLATGTPISNTLAEAWTMMRYIRPDLLQEIGAYRFDDFASTFGDVVELPEETPGGNTRLVARFQRYVNGPELLSAFRSATDVVLNDRVEEQLNREDKFLPPVVGGAPQLRKLSVTGGVKSEILHIRQLLEEFENMPAHERKQNSHIPLVAFGLAKKAAIDLRLIDPRAHDDRGSKTNRVVDDVLDLYQQTSAERGVQLIFSDLFRSPDNTKMTKGNGSKINPFYGLKRFNLFEDIKAKLIEKGVPESEIVIMDDRVKDADRATIIEQARQGKVRLLMGSTQRLGTGLSIQHRLKAVHHMDVPVRPMDFEQRNGRIIRQGNRYVEDGVVINVLAMEGTLDSYAFQRLLSKQRFINQLLRGDIADRSFEDPTSEDQVTYAEFQAATANNPLLLEKVVIEQEIRQLRAVIDGFHNEQRDVRRQISRAEEAMAHYESLTDRARDQVERLKKQIQGGKVTSVKIGDTLYEEKIQAALEELGERLKEEAWSADALGKLRFGDESSVIETILVNGLPVDVIFGAYQNAFGIQQYIKYRFNGIKAVSRGGAVQDMVGTTLTSLKGLPTSVRSQLKDALAMDDNLAHAIQVRETKLKKAKVKLSAQSPLEDDLRAKEARLEEINEELTAASENAISEEEQARLDAEEAKAVEEARAAQALRREVLEEQIKDKLSAIAISYDDVGVGNYAGTTGLVVGEEQTTALEKVLEVVGVERNKRGEYRFYTRHRGEPLADDERVFYVSDNKLSQVKAILDYLNDDASLDDALARFKRPSASSLYDVMPRASHGEIRTVVEKLGEGAPVRIVAAFSALPQAVQRQAEARFGSLAGRLPAVYHGGRVYLVETNMRGDVGVIEQTVLHEVVGHLGVRSLLGDDVGRTMDQIYRSFKGSGLIEEIAEQYGLDLSKREDRREVAEELVAHMAEADINASLLQQVIDAVRAWLRSAGFELDWSDADIRRLLREAKRFVRKGHNRLTEEQKRGLEIETRFKAGAALGQHAGAPVPEDLADWGAYVMAPVSQRERKRRFKEATDHARERTGGGVRKSPVNQLRRAFQSSSARRLLQIGEDLERQAYYELKDADEQVKKRGQERMQVAARMKVAFDTLFGSPYRRRGSDMLPPQDLAVRQAKSRFGVPLAKLMRGIEAYASTANAPLLTYSIVTVNQKNAGRYRYRGGFTARRLLAASGAKVFYGVYNNETKQIESVHLRTKKAERVARRKDAEQQVMDALRGQAPDQMPIRLRKLAQTIRKWEDGLWQYQHEAGAVGEAGYLTNHVRRVYDREVLSRDDIQREFIAVVASGIEQRLQEMEAEGRRVDVSEGDAKGAAEKIYESIMHGKRIGFDLELDEVPQMKRVMKALEQVGTPGNLKRRGLWFIPDAALKPFLVNDLGRVMTTSLNESVIHAEYVRRWGKNNERAKALYMDLVQLGHKDDAAVLHNVLLAQRGTLGLDKAGSYPVRRMASSFRTLITMTTMTFSALAATVEFTTPFLRMKAGAAAKGYQKAGGKLLKHVTLNLLDDAANQFHLGGALSTTTYQRWHDWFEKQQASTSFDLLDFAQRIGTVSEVATEQLMQERLYGYDKPLAKWEAFYFKANLLEPITMIQRGVAFAGGYYHVKDLLTKETLSERERRDLSRLGLPREDAVRRRMGRWLTSFEARGMEAETEGERLDFYNMLSQAVAMVTDQTVVVGSASTRPIYGSSKQPFFQLSFQLQSFIHAFREGPLAFFHDEITSSYTNGDYDELVIILAKLLPLLVMQYMADQARRLIQYDAADPEDRKLLRRMEGEAWTPKDIISRVERVGLLGQSGRIYNSIMAIQYGQSATVSAMGPAFSRGEQLARGVYQVMDSALDGEDGIKTKALTDMLLRTIPGFGQIRPVREGVKDALGQE